MSKVYYLVNEGKLSADEGVFRFDNSEGLARIPVENVKGFEIHSGCSITTGALRLAGKYNIVINVFGYYGNYMGTYWPKETYFSGDLTIKQSLFFSDEEKRIDLSRRLVEGAFENMLRLLKRFDGDAKPFDYTMDCSSIQKLMLVESRVRKEYFARLDQLLPEDFMLIRRERRPPTNYGNCLMSFGNSLLYSAIVTEARKTSVNITIPFYHSPAAGRFALALDLSEPFKPGYVDRFILQVIKQGIIKPSKDHFVKEGNGILLNKRGRKVFLEHWDKWMNSTSHHKKLKRNVSNRMLLRLEIHKYAKEVEDIEKYYPISLPRN